MVLAGLYTSDIKWNLFCIHGSALSLLYTNISAATLVPSLYFSEDIIMAAVTS